MITARINQIDVHVPEGTSILDAARRVQVNIPTLCKHKDLLPTAACGICIVRNKGGNKLIRACCTPLENNMEITTHDREIVDVRRPLESAPAAEVETGDETATPEPAADEESAFGAHGAPDNVDEDA